MDPDRASRRWNGEMTESHTEVLMSSADVPNLSQWISVNRVYPCFLNLDLRPRVSARSFVLSFVNFEPLDARPSSQCSSRTPLCFISSLIAMVQPGYISNSLKLCFLQVSAILFFLFRLEDPRQGSKTPLQRLWKGTSPGLESAVFFLSQVWISQFVCFCAKERWRNVGPCFLHSQTCMETKLNHLGRRLKFRVV